MKLIIAGSRSLDLTRSLLDALTDWFGLWELGEVVSGGAQGVDRAGEAWAETGGIPVRRFPADWYRYHPADSRKGNPAGHIRNAEMAVYADALLLIWDGESDGSAGMRREMLRRGKPVYEVVLKLSQVAVTASEPAGKG